MGYDNGMLQFIFPNRSQIGGLASLRHVHTSMESTHLELSLLPID